jgi:hypothetical protein
MGAYKYLEELWRKKQCDVLRFLMRVRTWEYRYDLASRIFGSSFCVVLSESLVSISLRLREAC